jgi:ABC-type branched-subunit amino acid transport system ATPase component
LAPTTDQRPLAEIDHVTAGYGGSAVLQELSLVVRPGITGIIGPNGAGKSTMLKTLLGYLRPVSGDVRFDGRSIVRLLPEERIKNGIAYIAQSKSYFTTQTIEENLLIGAYLVRDRNVVAERRDAVYARFPILRQRRHQLAGVLSGGEARILELGRMLMTAPRFAVLDEPSIGLSPKLVDAVYDEVRRLCEEGVAFLIVEQNVRKLLAVADFIYALDNGRNRFAGSPAALANRDLLAELYFGRATAGAQR